MIENNRRWYTPLDTPNAPLTALSASLLGGRSFSSDIEAGDALRSFRGFSLRVLRFSTFAVPLLALLANDTAAKRRNEFAKHPAMQHHVLLCAIRRPALDNTQSIWQQDKGKLNAQAR
jgi:hypothetical protein